MTLDEIMALPVGELAAPTAHLYLWCPNALLPDGIAVMQAWGFTYKSNIVWHKVRKDGGSDGRGVGFYFRNVTELILFGVRGKNARTLAPGRRQVNLLATRKREHSRKPDEQYDIIEACSPGPVSRTVRARHAQGLGDLGQPGRRRIIARPGQRMRTTRRRAGSPPRNSGAPRIAPCQDPPTTLESRVKFARVKFRRSPWRYHQRPRNPNISS